MVRTVISMEPDVKRWLDRKARRDGVPMSRIVRRAIDALRRNADAESLPLDRLLERTRGIWKRGDGLAYQRAVRKEWGRGR
jgi:hypothetical protein